MASSKSAFGKSVNEKSRPGKSNGIQDLTAKRLEQLAPSDLRDLATFAKGRLHVLPQSFISADDAVQKTLLHIIRGAQRTTPPRRPTIGQVQDKAAFLKYVKSGISAVIASAERKRALMPVHEPILEVDSAMEGERLYAIAQIDPENSATLRDLKNEIFSRLRRYAPPRLLPTINEWERTFFWTNRMPRQGSRSRRTQVRMLSMQVLKEMDENLIGKW